MPTITIRFSRLNHYCVVIARVGGREIYRREAPVHLLDRREALDDAKNAAFVWMWCNFSSMIS